MFSFGSDLFFLHPFIDTIKNKIDEFSPISPLTKETLVEIFEEMSGDDIVIAIISPENEQVFKDVYEETSPIYHKPELTIIVPFDNAENVIDVITQNLEEVRYFISIVNFFRR